MNKPSYPVPLNKGAIFSTEGTDPAAGADFDLSTVYNDVLLLEITSLTFRLVTDANAATRRPYIQWGAAGSSGQFWQPNATQTAGLDRFWIWEVGEGNTVVTIGGNQFTQMPNNIRHWGTQYPFRIVVENIQAGDQLSAIRLYGNQWALPDADPVEV